MPATIDVVEFRMGNELYAMDIQLAREIVEMVPITPLPRAPDYIAGIINLRGEITTVISINRLLGIREQQSDAGRKIIIMVPGLAAGSNVGIIVDDVLSVIQVRDTDIEQIEGGVASGAGHFVKGIIKASVDSGERKKRGEEGGGDTALVIWIDAEKIIRELVDLQHKS